MSFILTHDGTCAGDLNVQGSIILRETTVTSPTEKITIVAPDSVTADYTLVLPAAVAGEGQVLTDAAGDGVLSWASPTAATLQNTYDDSTSVELVLDATRGALTIKDNATPLGGSVNLFEILDNASGELFGVTSSGLTHTGIVTGGTLTDGTMTTTAGVMSVASLDVTNNVTQSSSGFAIVSTVTAAGVAGIAAHGDYLYSVSPGNNTLYIHKTSPFEDSVPVQIVAKVDGTNLNAASKVIHNGTILLIGGGSDSQVVSYNIDDPLLPVVLQNKNISTNGFGTFGMIDGSNLFTGASGSTTGYVYDVTDPTNMVRTRLFNSLVIPCNSVDTLGVYTYTCGGSDLGILKSEYVDPFQKFSSITTTFTVSGLALAEVVKVSGNYAYIGSMSLTSTGAHGIYVIDVSEPTAPVKIGVFTDGDTIGEVSDIIISGKYLYVLSKADLSLHRIDISDPTALVAAGTISGFSGHGEMVLSGGYIYVTNTTANTISKVNIQAANFPQISAGHMRSSGLIVDKDATFGGMVSMGSVVVGGGITAYGNISTNATFSVKKDIAFFGTSTANNYIIMKAADTITSHILTLPGVQGSSGQVLTDVAGDGVLSWETVAATLQDVYDGSGATELVVDSTRGALTIQDNATPLGANLFEIQDNSPAEVFGVTVGGMTHTGTVTTSGVITSGKGAVTQVTSVNTGVTTNARSGKITTITPLEIGSHLTETFTVTNSECTADSIVLCSVISYAGAFDFHCRADNITSGSFDIVMTNSTGGPLNAVGVIGFIVI